MLYICEGGGLGITRTHLKLVLSSRQRIGFIWGAFWPSPPIHIKTCKCFQAVAGPWCRMAGGRYPRWCQRPPADVVCCQLISAQVLKNLSAFATWDMLDVMVWGTEKYKEPSSSTPGHHTHHLPTPFPCSLLRCTRKKTQPRPVASPDVSPSLKKRPIPPIPAPLYPFKSRFLRKLSMDTTWAPSASPCSS